MELGVQKRAEHNRNMGRDCEERKGEKRRRDRGMERGE